jgi:hypothetical protein
MKKKKNVLVLVCQAFFGNSLGTLFIYATLKQARHTKMCLDYIQQLMMEAAVYDFLLYIPKKLSVLKVFALYFL